MLNKGNTCYLSVNLHGLSTFPAFWSNLTSECLNVSPLVLPLQRTISSLQSSKLPIDPSHLLKALSASFSRSGKPDFDLHAQQDAAEILEHVLSELSVNSIVSAAMLRIRI